MRNVAAAAAVLALVVGACGGGGPVEPPGAGVTTTVADGSVVTEGDLVEVHYVGMLDDGSVFDSSRERNAPLAFVVGSGQVIDGFDAAVRGLAVGETTTVRIPAEEAYGPRRDDLVVEVPVAPSQGDVAVGDRVTLSNGLPGVVVEVRDGTVVVDANHPLAGRALTFEIEVVAITRG